jgi:predicted MFS family arabinose efflux permease
VYFFGHLGHKSHAEVKYEESSESSTSSTGPSINYLKALRNPRFGLLIVFALTIGVGRQVLSTFLPYYLTEDIGLSAGQFGQVYLIYCLFTIALLYIGPSILSRMSAPAMLYAGLALMTGRTVLFALIRPSRTCPLQATLIELLGAGSFVLTHLAGVREAAACAPPGLEAGYQAIYSAAYVQFPAVLCSFFGGFIYRAFGGQFLMRLTAYFTMGTFVFVNLAFLKHFSYRIGRFLGFTTGS